MTKDEKNIKAIIDSGELDLGFCKLILKEIKGGKGASFGTKFKRKNFYKLSAIMSKEMKKVINTLR